MRIWFVSILIVRWTSALALAGFTATGAGPYNSDTSTPGAPNGELTWNYAGPDFTPGSLLFSGLATSGGVGSYLSELRWRITNPGGQSGYLQPTTGTTWTGTLPIGPASFSGLQTIFTGTSVGTWLFQAYESFDDAGLDAWWNDVSFGFGDYIPPVPSRWPGEVEGFETGVLPANHPQNSGTWNAVTTAGHSQGQKTTWYAETYGPAEGAQFASCEYDPALVAQDEWLLSPDAVAAPGMVFSGKTVGSVYWGKPPEQGGTYDNYDVQAWIIRGGSFGGDDDSMIAKLDDNWQVNWQWADFSYNLTGLLMPGETFRIGLRYVGTDGAQGGVDAILLTPEPASLALIALAGLILRHR